MIIIPLLAGSLFNRILGGLFDRLDQSKSFTQTLQKIGGTIICMLGFFLVWLFLSADLSGITENFWQVMKQNSGNLIVAFWATLGMYGGSTWGWGSYIGALGGWQSTPLGHVKYIDDFTDKLGLTPKEKTVSKDGETIEFENNHNLRVWGFSSLSLRGLLWGTCVSLAIAIAWVICYLLGLKTPTLTVLPMLGGIFMGTVYLGTIEIARKKWNAPGRGWPLGEWAFGAWFWPFCLFFV